MFYIYEQEKKPQKHDDTATATVDTIRYDTIII